jgi:heme/copper-type cytochrome/quinol oxidase subunit 2
MALTRRNFGLLVLGAAIAVPLVRRLFAQEPSAPNHPEFTLTAKNFRYSPDRLEVIQDDLVKITIQSEDVAYSFAIDEYRIIRRVPPGGATTFEFRADRPGTFRFYSNLTTDRAHADMQGQLVVRPK